MGGDDYTTFSSPEFDAHDYANAILAGEPQKSSLALKTLQTVHSHKNTLGVGQEDLSVALAKLNYGIDDVARQLRTVIIIHHEDLLTRAAGVSELEGSLNSIRQGLDSVDTSLEKLRLKIRVPYQTLSNHLARLQRLQVASDALRRTSRFLTLARRLESQVAELERMHSSIPLTAQKVKSPVEVDTLTSLLDLEGDRERIVAQAALNVAELTSLSSLSSLPAAVVASPSDEMETEATLPQHIDLRSIDAVRRHLPALDTARSRITAEMESMVHSSLESLNQSLLSSALQTSFNLRVLSTFVQSVLADLTEVVETRVKTAFDISALSRETGGGGAAAKDSTNTSGLNYRSRVRTEPTNITAVQWTSALWARLEALVEDMATCCIKVYVLEKVLRIKKDAATQISFLDEVMQALENKPSSTFWTSLAVALEKHSKDAATSSTFLQQSLTTGYPRFLRLFHDFFAKIAVHTDTVFTEAQQSPETILILRSISRFETMYLQRSTSRMNETVATALVGGVRSPPGATEGAGIARVAVNELDSARFDPLLVRSVAKNVVVAMEIFLTRLNTIVARDRMATLLTGPTPTPQQLLNAQLATTLYACWSRLNSLEGDYHSSVLATLAPMLKNMRAAFDRIVDPLLSAIRRELSAIISRLHRVDFGNKSMADPMTIGGGTSGYMKDLIDKLDFVRTGILGRYNVAELTREWSMSLVKHVVRSFVVHASIACPLSESGKLQLTSDMTELEFALSAFMVLEDGSASKSRNRNSIVRGAAAKLDLIGADYRALRGLRPLLFLETPLLASPASTAGLPTLIVIHHIIVRSSAPVLPLPHVLHEWNPAEYEKWVNEHDETDALRFVESCIPTWEELVSKRQADESTAGEGDGIDYILLVKTVLVNSGYTRQ